MKTISLHHLKSSSRDALKKSLFTLSLLSLLFLGGACENGNDNGSSESSGSSVTVESSNGEGKNTFAGETKTFKQNDGLCEEGSEAEISALFAARTVTFTDEDGNGLAVYDYTYDSTAEAPTLTLTLSKLFAIPEDYAKAAASALLRGEAEEYGKLITQKGKALGGSAYESAVKALAEKVELLVEDAKEVNAGLTDAAIAKARAEVYKLDAGVSALSNAEEIAFTVKEGKITSDNGVTLSAQGILTDSGTKAGDDNPALEEEEEEEDE